MDIPRTVAFFVSDIRARNDDYLKIDWPVRQSMQSDSKNVEHPVLVDVIAANE